MSFQQDFDELFNKILTDYRNQPFKGPDGNYIQVDTSQGSLIFIRSACLASALWGIYRHQEWVARQIFPDMADSARLEHHAWSYGIIRRAGESDDELLARLLSRLRKPPAGGNKTDYEQWALDIDNVAAAWCFPLAQGLGTVDVVILAREALTGSETPSSHATLTGVNTSVAASKLIDSAAAFITGQARQGDLVENVLQGSRARVVSVDGETELTIDADIFTAAGREYRVVSLCQEVLDHIDDVRPVTASAVQVLPPVPVQQNVSITLTGESLDTALITEEITAYLLTLVPGQPLYVSRLLQIALDNGADNAVVTTPSADVIPAGYEMLRPGVISVV